MSRFRFLVDVIAFSAPFLIGFAAATWVMREDRAAAPVESATVEPPAGLPRSMPTAVVILDQDGVDAAGLLTMYGILSASDELNVVTLAAKREAISIAPDLGVLPDLTLEGDASEDRWTGLKIVAIPPSVDRADPDVVAWLGAHVTDSTWILGSGNFLHALSAAGITEAGAIGMEDESVAADRRWTTDGRVIAAGSGTAVIDAAFHVLSLVFGDTVARRTAEKLWYERPLDPTLVQTEDPTIWDRIGIYLTAGFVWDKSDLAVAIFDGVDEMRLAAVLDLYPRVFDADLATVGATRRWFRSRHGLMLLPRLGIDEEPKIHELLLPGEADAGDLDRFQAYCAEEEVPMYNPFGGGGDSTFAYASTLSRIAAIRGSGVAKVVADAVRYPADRVALVRVPHWPYDVLIVPVTFGLLVVFVVRLARKKRHPRKKSRV